MAEAAQVTIDASQFPEAVRRDLLDSLRSRAVNHKFHYDSYKQTQQWLKLHQAYSPSRTEASCAEVYQRSFQAVLHRLKPGAVHLIGLGCGGGQKDSALLRGLAQSDRPVFYTPCDVSVAMVLVARRSAQAAVPRAGCFPVVCDLATSAGLASLLHRDLERVPSTAAAPARVLTFFGMLPNFEPETIMPKLAQLLGSEDHLLLSANLAPGADYAAGAKEILPLYDNALTRDWLLMFLLDLGVEHRDGELAFGVEEQAAAPHLKRITARFRFARDRTIELDSDRFEFHAGESIRLFFSYRHTPKLVSSLLGQYHLTVLDQWVTPSEQEGVFLVKKAR